MAIQFPCQACQQTLSIANRKVGTEIDCPKCGRPQTVPSEEVASAALAMSRLAVADQQDQSPPAAIGSPVTIGSEDATVSRATDEPVAVPEEMVLFKRETLYLQAVLLSVVPVLAFMAGYFVGRAGTPPDGKLPGDQAAIKEDVLMQGTLVWEPRIGQVAGDEAAVFIALPEGRWPESTLSTQGLRPQDPPPKRHHKSVTMIEQLGGLYARADASGRFPLVFPGPGAYRVLLISRHAARAEEIEVDAVELEQMKRYFQQAEHLIGRYKYRWSLEEIRVDSPPIEHNFGLDGYED